MEKENKRKEPDHVIYDTGSLDVLNAFKQSFRINRNLQLCLFLR